MKISHKSQSTTRVETKRKNNFRTKIFNSYSSMEFSFRCSFLIYVQIPLTAQAANIRYSPQVATVHIQTHEHTHTKTCHQNHNSSQIFFDFWLATSSLDSLCIAHLIDLDSEVIPLCRCVPLLLPFLRSPSLFPLLAFYC